MIFLSPFIEPPSSSRNFPSKSKHQVSTKLVTGYSNSTVNDSSWLVLHLVLSFLKMSIASLSPIVIKLAVLK